MITPSSHQSFFLVFLTLATTVSASAELLPRQSCDTLFCPSLPDLSWFWGIVGGGAAAWFGGQDNGREEEEPPPIEDFLLLQPPSSSSPETFQTSPSEDRAAAAHGKNPKAENENEIVVESPNSKKNTEECVATSQGGGMNDLLLPGQTAGFDNCDEKMEKVVWPVSCEDGEQNANTEGIMSEMGVKFFTIIDPGCVVQGGVFFWLVPKITPQQSQALYHQQAGSGEVRAIEDNPPLEFTETSESSAWTRVPANHRKKRGNHPNLSKRARVSVVKQNSDHALAFLSTGPKMKNSGIYSYFSQAGAGVRVYVLGSGFNYVSEEFSDRSISWIFANDVSPQKSDASTDTPAGRPGGGGGGRPTYPHSGTCLASKVLGKYHGVAKRADLTIVKMRPSAASFISAITQVIQTLRKKGITPTTKGRVVLNFTGGFVPIGNSDNFAIACERVVNILVNELQVVVVTSAGGHRRETYADISTMPALLSLEHNIITVGAVFASSSSTDDPPLGDDDDLMNGQRFPWSRGGSALTVSAPGNGKCIGPFGGEVDISTTGGGDVISTAIVTGLVAYLLSLPDLGDSLRGEGNTPEAVVRWLKIMSYRRFQAQESVWNGLDSESDDGEFENWLGNPPDK